MSHWYEIEEVGHQHIGDLTGDNGYLVRSIL